MHCHAPEPMTLYMCYYGNSVTSSRRHSVEVLSTDVGYFITAMVIDKLRHFMIRGEHGIQCLPCYSNVWNIPLKL